MSQNESYTQMVTRLQKPMGDFRFQLKHLMFFASIAGTLAEMAEQLDLVKKASLYEDPKRLAKLSQGGKEIYQMAVQGAEVMEINGGHPELVELLEQEENRHLVHHLIGYIGEAGELAAVLEQLITHGTFDKVNLIEELGDGLFYATGIMEAIGVTREYVERVNQDKLSTGTNARYKDGFSNEAALNRNLEGERANLEASTNAPIQTDSVEALDSAMASFINSELRKLQPGKSLILTPLGDELTVRAIDTPPL